MKCISKTGQINDEIEQINPALRILEPYLQYGGVAYKRRKVLAPKSSSIFVRSWGGLCFLLFDGSAACDVGITSDPLTAGFGRRRSAQDWA